MTKKYYALQYQTPDEIKNHGVYKSQEDALGAIDVWWDLNDFKPLYTRILGDNDLVIDYGLYDCFYLIKEVTRNTFEDRMFENPTFFTGGGMPK